MKECRHPYNRIYSAIVKDIHNDPNSDTIIWFACCDCGEALGEKILKKGE